MLHSLDMNSGGPKFYLQLLVVSTPPIFLDDTTSKNLFNRSFGNFSRILVDIDLRSKLINQFLVERSGYAFFVGIEYEYLPSFGVNPHNIDHSTSNCTNRLHSNIGS